MTTYTFKTIDPPGTLYTQALGINDLGQIVGFYQNGTNGGNFAFFYSNGIYTTIEPPGSISTIAVAINDSGQIVGNYFDSHQQGFLYSGGNYTTIDPAGSQRTSPLSINNSGQIVGVYLDGDMHDQGFLYSGGSYTVLDVPGAPDTTAFSINATGQIVGVFDDSGPGGPFHGFLYSNGIYTTLDVPGALDTYPHSINDKGEIAGSYKPDGEVSGIHNQGFVYSGGIYTILAFPEAINTNPSSINDAGQVVGWYSVETDGSITSTPGFVYSGGIYTTSDAANMINASGQIVGTYVDGSGFHGLLATPVTVPVPVMLNAVLANKLTTLSGTAEEDSSVSVFDGDKFIGAVTAGSDGTWSLQANVTGNVVHSFTETSTDLTGNTASSAGVTLYTPGAKHLLSGGNGDDVLIGRPNDTLTGGAGGDTFVFNPNFGKETVTDYNVNQDVLAFDHRLFDSNTASQVLSQTHDSKSGAVIVVDAGDAITLTDVSVAQLQAAQQAHTDWLIFF